MNCQIERPKPTDGGQETMNMKSKREPAIRCGDWLGVKHLTLWANLFTANKCPYFLCHFPEPVIVFVRYLTACGLREVAALFDLWIYLARQRAKIVGYLFVHHCEK